MTTWVEITIGDERRYIRPDRIGCATTRSVDYGHAFRYYIDLLIDGTWETIGFDTEAEWTEAQRKLGLNATPDEPSELDLAMSFVDAISREMIARGIRVLPWVWTTLPDFEKEGWRAVAREAKRQLGRRS